MLSYKNFQKTHIQKLETKYKHKKHKIMLYNINININMIFVCKAG